MLFSIAECCLIWAEMCILIYCERFGTSLYEAVTLVKERKLLADEEMIWRALD